MNEPEVAAALFSAEKMRGSDESCRSATYDVATRATARW